MKNLSRVIVLILFAQIASAQDQKTPYEFGSTVLSVNSLFDAGSYSQSKPPMEFMNGLYFRYTKARLGIRILSSYSYNTFQNIAPPSQADGSSNEGSNKDFRIGAGIQYNLLKTKDWLYAYTDILYRNVFSEGYFTDGFSGSAYSFASNSNGFDSFLGVGFKLKLFKSLYLSPELGYNLSFSAIETTNSPLGFGQVVTNTHYDVNANHILKIHVGVKF